MYRRGSSHRRRKCSAQVEEGNGCAKGEDDEPGSVASSVDASCRLEYLGCAGVNIPRAIKDCPTLLVTAVLLYQLVIPACGGRARTAKLVPARRMRAGSEVNAGEYCVG